MTTKDLSSNSAGRLIPLTFFILLSVMAALLILAFKLVVQHLNVMWGPAIFTGILLQLGLGLLIGRLIRRNKR